MNDYEHSDFRKIRLILHGRSPDGKDVTLDFRLERYMIVLYASLHFAPVFDQQKKTDGKNEGFTLYSLEKIAKQLGYKFDRTRSAGKIYDDQKKERRVTKKEIGDKTIYTLTEEGILYCKKCVKTFLAMCETQPSAWEPHTESTKQKFDRAFTKVQKMSEKEQKIWLKRNPGVLFSQPTEEEHKLDLLLRKIESP